MASQITNYKCPACTGPLHFVGASGMLECDFCGAKYDVAQIETLYAEKEAKAVAATEQANAKAEQNRQKIAEMESQGWDTSSLNSDWGAEADGMKAYSCPSCGAELICDASTAATSCPYCGNPTVVPGQFSGALKPDFVLPFKLSKEDAVAGAVLLLLDVTEKEERDTLRREFTANVSHELKTPLTAISGYAELIENGMISSDDEIRRMAGEIHNNSGRLITLINDVIRLSELDEEQDEILEKVPLSVVAQSSVKMLQINAEKHHVTLTFEGEDAFIWGTRQMVDEVVYNLCDNAIRYNKENGSVTVRVYRENGRAVLQVQDTGIGIPQECQERIFERFYRVDKGRSKLTGGTGLGLAIVKHILMRLKGELKLVSTPGQGTIITIAFPSCEEDTDR